jgi:hypothetical protein
MTPPVKTPEELEAEETPLDKERNLNARNPWVGWTLALVGITTLMGGAIAWCNG